MVSFMLRRSKIATVSALSSRFVQSIGAQSPCARTRRRPKLGCNRKLPRRRLGCV
jgi:hypothetical protein